MNYFKLVFLPIILISNIYFSFLLIAQEKDSQVNSDDLEKFKQAVQAVRDKEYDAAADLFLPLAESGDIDAQFNISILIRNGLGRPQNFSKALFWCWLAYSGGLEKADVVLEKLLSLVPEVAHDSIRVEVSEFIIKEVNEGKYERLMHLGKFYLKILSEPDYNNAYLFYSVAAAFGKNGAKEKRDEVIENIENEMIVEIQEKASLVFEALRQGEKISLPS